MTKFPMTVQGAENLRAELEKLKKEKPAVSQAIATAREHGDLKENAEYHAAREQMGFLEGRIQDIEARLSKFALEVLYSPKITDWGVSYDGRRAEPNNLPVKFPL